MAIRAGELDRRILLERQGVELDDHGGEVGGWAPIGTRWAKYMPGSAAERREAAQQVATITATFRVRRDTLTGTITPKDRLRFHPFGATGADSLIWQINSVVPVGRDAIDITATSGPM